MVKLIPLVQDLEAWKHHFREMAKGNRHGQYVVKGLGSKTEKQPIDIQMVSPTEAAVERAKALVHPKKNEQKKEPKRKKSPLLLSKFNVVIIKTMKMSFCVVLFFPTQITHLPYSPLGLYLFTYPDSNVIT